MLSLKIDKISIYDHKEIEYNLIESHDLEFILKYPKDGIYYHIFMYDNKYDILAAYINLNSDYDEEVVEYKPPKIDKDSFVRFKVDLYTSKTLSGTITSSLRETYDMRRHIDAFGLKLSQRIIFYVDYAYNPYVCDENGNEDCDAPFKYIKPKEIDIFKTNKLSPNKQKWCRCILKLSSKFLDWYKPVKYYEDDPTIICSKYYDDVSSVNECSDDYKLTNLTLTELVGYANLNKIYIPLPYGREILLKAITDLIDKK